MWKEKLYTGTLSDTSGDTTTITRLPSTYTATVNIAKTDLLNQKIKDFLNECGVSNVTYYPCSGSDERKGNIYINGVPFQFIVISTSVYFSIYAGGYGILSGSSGTTVIFSGNDYSIRICLAGNPSGSFGFAIGRYNDTAYSMTYLMLYKLKSAIDNSDWYFITYNGSAVFELFVKSGTDGETSYNMSLSSLDDNANNDLSATFMSTLSGGKYPLIPRYIAWFKIVDGYNLVSSAAFGLSNASTPANSYFIKIGSNTYFVPYASFNGIIIDCG